MIAKNSLSASIPASTPRQPERSAPSGSSFFPTFYDGRCITRLNLDNSKVGVLAPGVDYLTVTGRFDSLHQIESALLSILDSQQIFFSDKFWSSGHGAQRYDFRLEHPIASGGYSYNSDFSCFFCCLRLPGAFFSSLTLSQQFEKVRLCYLSGFRKCSRIDLKLDDYSFQINPYKQMSEAANSNNIFGAKHYHPHADVVSGELVGYGDYYGSRNSAYFLRNYVHTFGEDEYHSMRMELEIKRKKAQLAYDVLVKLDPSNVLSWDDIVQDEFVQLLISDSKISYLESSEISDNLLEHWANLISQIIVGAFDFRDKSVADSRRDSPRLDWWQEFIDLIGGCIRIRLSPNPPTLPKTVRWMRRQWLTTLAQLKYGLGINGFNNFMQTLADYGNHNLKNYHLANIEFLMANPDFILDFWRSEYEF